MSRKETIALLFPRTKGEEDNLIRDRVNEDGPYPEAELRRIQSLLNIDSISNDEAKRRLEKLKNHVLMLYKHNLLSIQEASDYLKVINKTVQSLNPTKSSKEKQSAKEQLKYAVVRALIVTADGYLVIQKRPEWSKLEPSKFTLPGGKIEKKAGILTEGLRGHELSPHLAHKLALAIAATIPQNILRELTEELGITKENVVNQAFSHFTVTQNKDGSLTFTAFYTIRINLTREELNRLVESATHRRENDPEVTFIDESGISSLTQANTAFGYEQEIRKMLKNQSR